MGDDHAAAEMKWLDDWREWLEGDLFEQIHEILWVRAVCRSWADIVEEAADASKTSGFFHQWINRAYVTTLAVSVRRMCDKDRRTRSLVRLLSEIRDHAEELTRDWWLGRWWPDYDEPPAHHVDRFERLSSAGDHIDPAILNSDLERLAEVCDIVKLYVDKHVAHLDADRHDHGPVTLADIHAAADTVYEIFHRWYQLVTNAVLDVPVAEPWEHIVRLTKAAGVPPLTPLKAGRHTWATLALEAEIPAKIVAERLGHSTIATTLDMYSHVSERMDRGAAERVAALVDPTSEWTDQTA